MCIRNPIHCIIPPYITEHLAQSDNLRIRDRAVASLAAAQQIRGYRGAANPQRSLMPSRSLNQRKHRKVYDAQRSRQLPGQLIRSEGDAPVLDEAVNEAYDFTGDAYDFYEQVFDRNSLDDNGMTMISSVHIQETDNAFWYSEHEQMGFGDGVEGVYRRLTCSLDVVGHEFTHGVQAFTSNLKYEGQSGSLSEHFADVFGSLLRQWKNRETAANASWLIGAEIWLPAGKSTIRRGIRDMENPGTAYEDFALGGKDPQRAHMRDFYIELDSEKHRDIHYNSGIPNRAFVLIAKTLGGYAWKVAGQIWYKTMLRLSSDSRFGDCAKETVRVAETDHGAEIADIVRTGWKNVGITVSPRDYSVIITQREVLS